MFGFENVCSQDSKNLKKVVLLLNFRRKGDQFERMSANLKIEKLLVMEKGFQKYIHRKTMQF